MGFITFVLYSKIIDVFGDNAVIGLCFYIATLFKDFYKQKTTSFPILNIFGPKGSGKTELAETMMAFFVVGNDPQNIETATVPALADAVASVSNALVHIDEYKNGIDTKKIEWLKDLWACIGRSRMNMDKDKKREQARVDSGIILTGQEMPTADIALFTRLIFLAYDRDHHNQQERERFAELMQLRMYGATHITILLSFWAWPPLPSGSSASTPTASPFRTTYWRVESPSARSSPSRTALSAFAIPMFASITAST